MSMLIKALPVKVESRHFTLPPGYACVDTKSGKIWAIFSAIAETKTAGLPFDDDAAMEEAEEYAKRFKLEVFKLPME